MKIPVPSDAESRDVTFEVIEEAFLSRVFGENPLGMGLDHLTEPDLGTGVLLTEHNELVFDAKIHEADTRAMMQRFIDAVDSGEFANSRFAYFFAEETEEFVRTLADHLRQKLAPPDELHAQSLAEELQERIESATDAMGDFAKRERIRKAVQDHLTKIPIDKIYGIDPNDPDKKITLRFNRDDVTDPQNEVDFLYVANERGEPELLVVSKREDREIAGFSVVGKDEADWRAKGQFGVANPEKKVDSKATSGENFSYYQIDITKGGATTAPLFKKMRFMVKPLDISEAIHDLENERNGRMQQQRQAQRPAYSPPPQSAPSSPSSRWSRPTSYVSVSH